jgi:hypothetical protein
MSRDYGTDPPMLVDTLSTWAGEVITHAAWHG